MLLCIQTSNTHPLLRCANQKACYRLRAEDEAQTRDP